jgi:hypothetical protein
MTMTALDAAFAGFSAGGEAEALRFYQLFADTPLCLLLAAEAEGEAIAPQVFDLSDGPVVLVFDSEERLAGFQTGPVPYATLPGRVIAQGLVGQGVSLGLNLGTGAASETLLPPEALEHLLSLLDVAPQETAARPVGFAAPDLPAALSGALQQALRAASGLAGGAVLAAVRYDSGARGHMLAIVGADPAAEPALARAVAEALAFAGLEAAALDVTFLAPEDPALAAMAAHGTAFAIKAPELAAPAPMPAAPGTDPSRPPRLR